MKSSFVFLEPDHHIKNLCQMSFGSNMSGPVVLGNVEFTGGAVLFMLAPLLALLLVLGVV